MRWQIENGRPEKPGFYHCRIGEVGEAVWCFVKKEEGKYFTTYYDAECMEAADAQTPLIGNYSKPSRLWITFFVFRRISRILRRDN